VGDEARSSADGAALFASARAIDKQVGGSILGLGVHAFGLEKLNMIVILMFYSLLVFGNSFIMLSVTSMDVRQIEQDVRQFGCG
jgi:hypothetical protein